MVVAAVVEKLRVDHCLLIARQRDRDLGALVELVTPDHQGARVVVGELQPDAHHPAVLVGVVGRVVVVQVQTPAALAHRVGLHLEQLHAAEAGADRLDPADDRRAFLGVLGPDTVEVGLAVRLEALELELTRARRDRREGGGVVSRVSGVGEVLVLVLGDLRAVVLLAAAGSRRWPGAWASGSAGSDAGPATAAGSRSRTGSASCARS